MVNMGGHGHQEVPHLHVHIFGGRQFYQMIPD
jgi:diadenosine tetraphosphate (Ap4A) HIT family hydrolase